MSPTELIDQHCRKRILAEFKKSEAHRDMANDGLPYHALDWLEKNHRDYKDDRKLLTMLAGF